MNRRARQVALVAGALGSVALLRLAIAGNGFAAITLETAVAVLLVLGRGS